MGPAGAAPDPLETCAACGFDGAQYDRRDTLGTLRALGAMWRWATEGIDDEVLHTRPAPEVWSAAEHADHSAETVGIAGLHLARLLGGQDATAAPGAVAVPTPPTVVRFDDALERLGRGLGELGRLVRGVAERDPVWARTLGVGHGSVDAGGLLHHALHDVTHHLMDVGRGLQRLGAGAPRQQGVVAQVNVSDGGVPKMAVAEAQVTARGLVGDRQRARQHHGRPWQALCLWSLEVVEALAAEGHPIAPGAAGENLTLAGIDWATLRPGTRLQIGAVLAEVSAWTQPCTKNARWFADRDFRRIDHDRHPGWSRAYAWVRTPGVVRTGEPVVVEP